MPTQVQFRRGSTSQNNSFTGAVGEVSVDTDKDTLRVHDGSTQGGFELAKSNLSNISSVGIITATTFVGALTSCTGLPLTTGVTGTLPVANGGTGVTASTGTGSVVLSASPTFTGTVGAAAITATGDIAAANFNSTSDISLKGNIKIIEDPIKKILQLNGVTFNWKENQKPSIGVIAQELEKVFPELVTQGDVKSVNYSGLIGVLIEAVKEQQKQIEELRVNNIKLE